MKKVIIIATDIESGEQTEYTLKEAKNILSSYWYPDEINGMLLAGIELFTPFSTYKIKTQ